MGASELRRRGKDASSRHGGQSSAKCDIGEEITTGSNEPRDVDVDFLTRQIIKEDHELDKRSTLFSKLKEVPGMVLFVPWLCMYQGICWVTRKLAKKASATASTEITPAAYEEMKQLWVIGACCFGIVILVQTSHIIFQISAKKRILGSLIFFITSAACTTYIAQARGWVVPVILSNGRELQLARYLEWMSTTVMMILTIHASGNSQNKTLVKSWKDTITCIAWDEAMLISGMLHSTYSDVPLIKYPSLVFSAACLLMVFRGVGKVIKDATRNATTEYERFSMKAIGYITFVTWTMLAMPQTLYHEGFMTWLQYEWISTCFDMLTKTVYAVTLLTGNFCILDVVQTIRAAQLKAEKRRGALQSTSSLTSPPPLLRARSEP